VYTFFVKINTRHRISDKDDVSEFVGRIRKRRREVILAGSDERTFYKIINSVISLKSLMLFVLLFVTLHENLSIRISRI